MDLIITSYCRIVNKHLLVNGKEISLPKEDSASYFLADAYKALEINYPKFHKMDNLCKLGLVATEAVFKGNDFLKRNDPGSTAIILANNASSLDTDRMHQSSINDKDHYLPSPATFVYTLPNIVIGEIAIKHKITGENVFFVEPVFDALTLTGQAELLLKQQLATAAICGWVNYDNGAMDALIYLVEIASDSIKNVNFIPLNNITVNQLYTQK